MLQSKIDKAIETLRKYEKLALKYSPDGFHVAFSGGKDSQVIYELCHQRKPHGKPSLRSPFYRGYAYFGFDTHRPYR